MSDYALLRERMVRELVAGRGVHDPRVLEAMREVPRHLFVREHLRAQAYGDHALPIGSGQTISQPYIVARMTEQGILREITGQSRNRLFRYQPYIDLFSENTRESTTRP